MKKNLLSTLITAAASVLLALTMAGPGHATTAQDAWWNPNESGWALNVVQEGGTLGFAMYVYDNNSNPTWYLGAGSGSLSAGFSGTMYRYRGPYFGAVFNPATVSSVAVGSFTFRVTAVNSATFTYTIDGVAVAKTVQRLSAVGNANLTGAYTGALVYRIFDCNTSNPQNYIDTANFTVAQNNTAVTITAGFATGATCTYTGTYSQEGRYGRLIGTYTCSSGASGNYDMFEIDTNSQAFSGRYTGTLAQGALRCNQEGRMGGLSTSLTGF